MLGEKMKEYKSNAKINLMLKVVGRKDNLHLLEMVMVPISIYDIIQIEKSKEFIIEGMDIDVEDNIMYKMFSYLKEKYKLQENIKIKIEKFIPTQAGLGGGSSNTATILKHVNEEMKLNLKEDEMISIGKNIGSDVSFFIKNAPSFVKGTGEDISVLNNFKQVKGILIFDNDYSSTKDVYDKIDDYEFSKAEGKFELINDLEKGITDQMKSKIVQIKTELKAAGAYATLMSGSGGSVFGLFESENDIDKCISYFKEKYYYSRQHSRYKGEYYQRKQCPL